MKRRILCLVLCLGLLAGMIPTGALAATEEEPTHTCTWAYAPTEDGAGHIAMCDGCGERYEEPHDLAEGRCTLCHWVPAEDSPIPSQEATLPETTTAFPETEATEPVPTEPVETTESTQPVCPHENTRETNEIPATCAAPGQAAGVICIDCGGCISGGEVLPQLSHVFESGVCTLCQFVCPHPETEGQTAGSCCPVCGMVLPESGSALPYGFTGMPQGYTLSGDQTDSKEFLVNNDCLTTLAGLEEGTDYAAGSIIFWADTEEEAQAIAAAYNAELTSYSYNVGEATLQDATVAQALEVAMDPGNNMPAVEPNYITTMEPLPDVPASDNFRTMDIGIEVPQELSVWENFRYGDPFLSDPSNYNYQWYHDMINSYEAWGVTQGAGVTVAVLDTGVDATHEDLAGKVTCLTDNFTAGTSGTHGTHVAGIIAATQGNGYGGAGVAPEAKILSINVCDSNGRLPTGNIARAIEAAASKGVAIINMSLGGPYTADSYVLQQAINKAYERRVTVFAAMGNDHSNSKSAPACLDHVIAITAVNRDGYLAYFSSFGSWADLAAPGQAIMSSIPSGYALQNGTSMACPVAAGVAALYISALGYNPGPDNVEAALKKAVTKGYGNSQMGKGIVNAANLFASDRSAPYISLNGVSSLDAASQEPVVLEAGSLAYSAMESMTAEERDAFYASAIYSADNTANAAAVNENSRSNTSLYIYPRGNATDLKMLIVTTDGTNPTIKNGLVTNGTVFSPTYRNGGVRIGLNSFPTRTKVTIKAAYVSGMGVMGNIATMTFTVSPSWDSAIGEVRILGGDTSMAPGKSLSLFAVVEPYSTANQSVTWEITEKLYAPGAKISAKGVLTTKTSDWGTITLRATSVVDSSVYGQITVDLTSPPPLTKSIELSANTLTLGYNLPGKAGTAQLQVKKLTNAYGQNVTGDAQYGVVWTSSNPNVVGVDDSGCLTALSLGKATITCTANDGSKKSAKCTVTVVTPPEAMTITGQSDVTPGKSATLKVDVYPASANKTVSWSLAEPVTGVTLSSKGVLKVDKSVPTGGYVIVQAASATGAVTAVKRVYITEATSYVRLKADNNSDRFQYSQRKDGTLISATIYSVNIPGTYFDDHTFRLKAEVSTGCGLVWSSSNPAVASVTSTGVVTGHKSGAVTITCKANDGSGKKATTKITVITPASYVTINTKLNTLYGYPSPDKLSSVFKGMDSICLYTLGYGKSATHTVTLGDTYGKPSKAKVTWSWEMYRTDSDTPYNYTSYASREKLVSVSSSGRLTISKKMANLISSGSYCVVLYATARYAHHEVTTGLLYQVIRPATKLRFAEPSLTFSPDEMGIGYVVFFIDDMPAGNFTVTSSNPKVINVTGQVGYSSSHKKHYIPCIATETGTAKLIVKAQDGSGKTATLTVKVG